MHELSVLSLLRNIFESSENKCIAAGRVDTHILQLRARSDQIGTQCGRQTLQTRFAFDRLPSYNGWITDKQLTCRRFCQRSRRRHRHPAAG